MKSTPEECLIVSLGDQLRALGSLGDDPSPDALQSYMRNARALVLDLEDGDRELLTSMLVQRLKDAGVQAPARVVKAYLAPHRQETEPEELLNRGDSVATAQLIAVSADPGLVAWFADELLEGRGADNHDPVAAAVQEGRRTALRLVRDEVEAER